MASGDTILKSGLARTVLLRRRRSADTVVVKRFHSPSSIQALRDRARAVSEHRLLTALRARDLRVPRPLAVRRRQGSWEVVMEWIPAAPPLSEVLSDPGWDPASASAGALAAALGRLLAGG